MKSERRTKKKEKKRLSDTTTEPDDLKELTHDELSGTESKDSSLASSSTDEDEDEGVGDGKMGRSSDDILGRD